ncbi:phage portal protein [Pleionea sp. CnH1-48]|uniref:phage portal protein n=1 Tax=Pleionea sp. CnH1-48 TaxID=2954494 RepID=UPI0020969346|nr:phage portal protein [Pleionea sp. CnH1-48]MCO7225767.1 phage portal protein [Pleionea sp. CnH1-48]
MLTYLFEKRNAENPDKPLTSMTLEDFGGNESASGVAVSEANALRLSAVYTCINVISKTLAMLPVEVSEKTKDGNNLKPKHPLKNLLNLEPNMRMTAYFWRLQSTAHAAGWGNAYSYIERAASGRPLNLLPLNPWETEPIVKNNGELIYRTLVSAEYFDVPAQDILHIPALGWDGVKGISPIKQNAESIGLTIAAQRFGSRLFKNNARPSGVLIMKDQPGKGSKAASNLAGAWRKAHGSDGQLGTAVLEGNIEYKQLTIPPEDAQYLQTRKLGRSEVAGIFGVPAHMINDLEKATFSNITELNIFWVQQTVQPWVTAWEQEINRKLFLPSEKGKLFVKFNLNALLRGTPKDRADYYGKGIKDGWLTRNEARELEDLNPIESLGEPLVPLNMTTPALLEEQSKEEPEKEPDDEAQEEEEDNDKENTKEDDEEGNEKS